MYVCYMMDGASCSVSFPDPKQAQKSSLQPQTTQKCLPRDKPELRVIQGKGDYDRSIKQTTVLNGSSPIHDQGWNVHTSNKTHAPSGSPLDSSQSYTDSCVENPINFNSQTLNHKLRDDSNICSHKCETNRHKAMKCVDGKIQVSNDVYKLQQLNYNMYSR